MKMFFEVLLFLTISALAGLAAAVLMYWLSSLILKRGGEQNGNDNAVNP